MISDLTDWFKEFVTWCFWKVVALINDVVKTVIEGALNAMPAEWLQTLDDTSAVVLPYMNMCEFIFPLQFLLSVTMAFLTFKILCMVANKIYRSIPGVG